MPPREQKQRAEPPLRKQQKARVGPLTNAKVKIGTMEKYFAVKVCWMQIRIVPETQTVTWLMVKDLKKRKTNLTTKCQDQTHGFTGLWWSWIIMIVLLLLLMVMMTSFMVWEWCYNNNWRPHLQPWQISATSAVFLSLQIETFRHRKYTR